MAVPLRVKVSQAWERFFASPCRWRRGIRPAKTLPGTWQARRCNPNKDITLPTDSPRPNPEHFLTLIRQQQRGRLKVYLGFAAGVGKTYEMLQEGHRLRRQGVDVVTGVIETHGRAETAAQVGDLEQVPRRRIEYRGVVLEEMDLDAILKRHPTIVLVDELAHTN